MSRCPGESRGSPRLGTVANRLVSFWMKIAAEVAACTRRHSSEPDIGAADNDEMARQKIDVHHRRIRQVGTSSMPGIGGTSRPLKNAETSSFRGAGDAREPGNQEHGPEKSTGWPVYMGFGPGPGGPSRNDIRVFQQPATDRPPTSNTVTVYPMFFTAAELAVRCLAPLAALGRACGAPKGGRAGARASRSIPASPVGGRWWGPLDPGCRRRAGRQCEERGEIRDQCAQRRHRCELVILARELRPSARPWPVLGTARQSRDHRIESDITRGRQQMRLAHHHRAKAALEQMARPPEPSVDGPGVAPVRFGKSCPQPIRARRRHAKWA